MKNRPIALVINIPNATRHARADGYYTRKAALEGHVSIITSLAASKAIIKAIRESRNKKQIIRSLQSQ